MPGGGQPPGFPVPPTGGTGGDHPGTGSGIGRLLRSPVVVSGLRAPSSRGMGTPTVQVFVGDEQIETLLVRTFRGAR